MWLPARQHSGTNLVDSEQGHVLMIATLLLTASLASQPQDLAADHQWTLATEDKGCAIERSVGGTPQTSVGIQANIVGAPWLFVTAPKKQLPDGIGETRVTLQPSGATYVLHYGSFDTRDEDTRLVRLFPDKDAMAAIARASTMSIGKKRLQVDLAGIGHAIGAARDCTAKLLSSWGADPKLYLAGKIARMGNFGRWIGSGDFPANAHSGDKVVALVQFDADGKPTDCRAVISPDDALSSATCRIAMQHLTATMPLDDAGNPIASYAITTVNWVRP